MTLRLIWPLLFIGLPLVEIVLLIEVGERIGSVVTVGLVVFSAVLGGLLIRHQGFYTLNRARASMERGEVPAVPLFEGVLLVVGGLFLLLPGFLTDAFGLCTLVPPLRRAIAEWFLRRVAGPPPPPRPGGGADAGPRTIEGEYRRDD